MLLTPLTNPPPCGILYTYPRGTQYITYKEEHTMFNIFKTRKATDLYKVTYKFIEEDEVFTTTATSAGLASIEADWAIEVLSVAKV